jgi:uncharacterized protein
MKKIYGIFLVLLGTITAAFSQADSVFKANYPSIFERISKSIKEYKLDTSAAPNDKITMKITELRNLRGGFNINEAIEFKLEEDKQKGEIPAAELAEFAAFMKSGNGKRWLDNAVVWIYRNHFTYRDLKQMVKFYKTAAGRKMAEDFPIVMLESLTAAEKIKEIYGKK